MKHSNGDLFTCSFPSEEESILRALLALVPKIFTRLVEDYSRSPSRIPNLRPMRAATRIRMTIKTPITVDFPNSEPVI